MTKWNIRTDKFNICEVNFFLDPALSMYTILSVRSFVGVIPLLAVTVIESKRMESLPGFKKRFAYFREHCNDSCQHIIEKNSTQHQGESAFLLTLPSERQLRIILKYLLDENEFLSDYGLRSLSKVHEKHPCVFKCDEEHQMKIIYAPAESKDDTFGGNSNWRGPIWLCINHLIIEALERFVSFVQLVCDNQSLFQYRRGEKNLHLLTANGVWIGKRNNLQALYFLWSCRLKNSIF